MASVNPRNFAEVETNLIQTADLSILVAHRRFAVLPAAGDSVPAFGSHMNTFVYL
jgi:hypothetical protein